MSIKAFPSATCQPDNKYEKISQSARKAKILKKMSFDDFVASNRAWAACVVLIAVLSLGLGGLVWLLQTPNQSLPRFQDHFQALRDQEATWNSAILSLQLGIAANYDAVSNAGHDMKVGTIELQDLASSDPALSPLLPDVKTFRQSVEKKEWLSEQVKASYAMLRNSATVIPQAISDAYQQVDVQEPIASLNRSPSDLITQTITGMTSFTITPTPQLRGMIQRQIAATRAATGTLSPELSAAVERFLVQIEVVTREREHGNELMLAVAAVPTGAAADRIETVFQSLQESHNDAQRDLQLLALLLSALLVITFAAFVFVLWRRFVQLDEDNRMLLQVNKDVEEQLMQSAKLSALGQMVAGITHELNTPLAYVRAVFELIRERVLARPELVAEAGSGRVESEAVREWREELQVLLDDGLHGLDEMTTLVRTMKNFSRLDKGHIETFSVEEGLESALLIARPQLKYVADVKCEFDSVPEISGSSSQLRQVFLNLIVNAGQAMASRERRGLLTVRTRITSSDMVQIDVCDNGCGIPEENLGKIFDPFFTTKPVGEGSGMGLSICYRIVENHGGTIAVNSKLGKGTVFTITLPRQDEKYSPIVVLPNQKDDSLAPLPTT